VSELLLLAPVSCTNKTERHDISEILLKMTLNTLTVTVYFSFDIVMFQALAGSCAGHDCLNKTDSCIIQTFNEVPM
jgi:hypothetical protein